MKGGRKLKNFKYFLLLVVIMALLPITAQAKGCDGKVYQDDEGNTTISYNDFGYIPQTLPSNCDTIEFPAYYQANTRGEFLHSFISRERGCLVTLSIPDIKELDYYNLECNYPQDDRKHCKAFMTVTIEPLDTDSELNGENGIVADSTTFIWDASQDPIITILFSDYSSPYVKASEQVVSIRLCSREKLSGIKSTMYQIDGAGMDNYEYWGWGSGSKQNGSFSTTELYLPVNMVNDTLRYIDVYHESLTNKKTTDKKD